MLKYISPLFIILFTITNAYAFLDMKLGATNSFLVRLVDRNGNPYSSGLALTDIAVTIRCAGNTLVTVDETGDSITAYEDGIHLITVNDTIGNDAEDQCYIRVAGQSGTSYVGSQGESLVYMDEKFKSVGATIDAINDISLAVYNIIDLTNEGGDQNPTTTSSDTDMTYTVNISGTLPKPILQFPTISELSTQDNNCNVQGLRTQITGYNTTTKVITYQSLPIAPDYRCKFRIY